MELVFFWLVLSAVVAGAANSRGRSGFGWLLLALVLSPVLAGLLLCALRQKRNDTTVEDAPVPNPPEPIRKETAFEPDGIYAGFPYKVSEGGAVEVLLSGGRVRFRNIEQFLALANQGA